MESVLLYAFIALALSIVLNILLQKIGVSQIIGYIVTGTMVVYAFDLRHVLDSHSLELLAEFGIVFLMFTIGLEMSLSKMNSMKKDIFGNGLMQVGISAVALFMITYFIFALEIRVALLISLAFSLSSTAVVLSYLKSSKEIYHPYGQRSVGILIFQDIAVIPILILIGFFSMDDLNVTDIIVDTTLSAILVVGLLFVVGKRLMTYLLHFSADSGIEELFIGSVLVIVIGASLLAHYAGFTYSLGAFVAGMIIAETKYHYRVEADIGPFKNLLLGLFFVTVGMKIDLLFFFGHIGSIVGILVGVFALKGVIIYSIIKLSSDKLTSFKTALALSQVGEFSFAIFALAGSADIIDDNLSQMLVLIVVLSMIITPFIIARLEQFSNLLYVKEESHTNIVKLDELKNHVVVVGYSVVGKFVTHELERIGASYAVVDNSLKHVKEGIEAGEKIILGDLSKQSMIEALHVKECSAVIVTLDNIDKKRLICEAILSEVKDINLIVKVISLEDKEKLQDLPITVIVDGKVEVARILVERMGACELEYY